MIINDVSMMYTHQPELYMGTWSLRVCKSCTHRLYSLPRLTDSDIVQEITYSTLSKLVKDVYMQNNRRRITYGWVRVFFLVHQDSISMSGNYFTHTSTVESERPLVIIPQKVHLSPKSVVRKEH